MSNITIYTDGSCLGNPGKGGWAAILIVGDKRKEIIGGYRYTTNNRMEIMAVIEALTIIKNAEKHNIILYTDSKLVVDAFNEKWIESWKEKNWYRKSKKMLNYDLWERLYSLAENCNIIFRWCKGHNGIKENERCDILCKSAAKSNDLAIDFNYEKSKG